MRSICGRLGVGTILGGEFEGGLVRLAERLSAHSDGGEKPAPTLRANRSPRNPRRGTRASPTPTTRRQPEPIVSLERLNIRGARPDWDARAREICAPDYSGRWLSRGRIDRGQPRVQTSLPALPDRAGLQRRVPHCEPRRGDGGCAAAGSGGRAAYFVRRSGLFQRNTPCDGAGGRISCRISRCDLRRDHQDRAFAEIRAAFDDAARHGLPVRDQRGGVGRRRNLAAAGQRPHARGLLACGANDFARWG